MIGISRRSVIRAHLPRGSRPAVGSSRRQPQAASTGRWRWRCASSHPQRGGAVSAGHRAPSTPPPERWLLVPRTWRGAGPDRAGQRPCRRIRLARTIGCRDFGSPFRPPPALTPDLFSTTGNPQTVPRLWLAARGCSMDSRWIPFRCRIRVDLPAPLGLTRRPSSPGRCSAKPPEGRGGGFLRSMRACTQHEWPKPNGSRDRRRISAQGTNAG